MACSAEPISGSCKDCTESYHSVVEVTGCVCGCVSWTLRYWTMSVVSAPAWNS